MFAYPRNALFVVGTSANVGKTVCSLGLISGLKNRMKDKVAYMKPVGGYVAGDIISLEDGTQVDKDAKLVRDYFKMDLAHGEMSPILAPPGFFSSQLVNHQWNSVKARTVVERNSLKKIREGFERMQEESDFVVLEGTGHAAMGSLMRLTSARVAAELDVDVVLVANGKQRLAATMDDLALNRQMCLSSSANIRGVIVNRVEQSHKLEWTKHIKKALELWGIPLLGVIPESKYLSMPSMSDFERLFGTKMFSGKSHGQRRFEVTRLVTGSVDEFRVRYASFDHPHHLHITHSSREDIFKSIIELQHEYEKKGQKVFHGIVTTGNYMPSAAIVSAIQAADIPAIYVPTDSYHTMNMIAQFVPQTHPSDLDKIETAIDVVRGNIDFEQLMQPLFAQGVGRF